MNITNGMGDPISDQEYDKLIDACQEARVAIRKRTEQMIAEKDHVHLGDLLSSATTEFVSQLPSRKHWHCTRGCAYCCSVGAPITPPEAFLLARELKRLLSPSEMRELLTKLHDRAARAKAVNSIHEYIAAKIPCAFLTEDNSCGVYNGRPIACKSYASFSRDSCRSVLAQEPGAAMEGDEAARHLGGALICGFKEAILQAHLDGEFYELHGSMLVALRDGAYEHWLAGEKLFTECSVMGMRARKPPE